MKLAWILGIPIAVVVLAVLVIPGCEIFATWCSANELFISFKSRCGFRDLGQLVTIEGTFIQHNAAAGRDHDWTFTFVPDPAFEDILYYEGRMTNERHSPEGTLHIEFTPCQWYKQPLSDKLAEIGALLDASKLVRARVTGQWVYDGVDHQGEDDEKILKCLGGRPPDPDNGWTEIHSGTDVWILE